MKHMFILLFFFLVFLQADNNISVQLKWHNQFQFAGFYVAKEKGFYKDLGLNVTIKEKLNDTNIIKDVISGNSTYGLGSSSLLLEYNKNRSIVAIAAMLQHSPSVLITTNKNIQTLFDLKNKNLMITQGILNSIQIKSMLQSHGITKKDIDIHTHSHNLENLINQEIDIYSGYLTNEPYILNQKNIDYTLFDPKDYGFDFYGDILFTSQNEIKNHPQRVKKFYEATKKGWLWAYENIEATAKLIFEKYNTNNKSLEHLIFEGESLKKIAFDTHGKFGLLDKNKFNEIAKIYLLNRMLTQKCAVENFIDPLYVTREKLVIGVLAKRGFEKTIQRWQTLLNKLNDQQNIYHFILKPLSFDELSQSVHEKKIDFLITNSLYYVWLEYTNGISRIATLLNNTSASQKGLTRFGGVIFTRSENDTIQTINDLKNKKFGAVDEKSFGGWIMAQYELLKHNIKRDNLKLKFFHTHDLVVDAVLNKEVEVGTVRSDTLEQMAKENLINLEDIKIISQKKFQDFPYLLSTDLYPEWPIAKLAHTDENAAKIILPILLNSDNWTIPLDYSKIHTLLRELKLPPYDSSTISFDALFEKYKIYFITLGVIFIIIIHLLISGLYKNRVLEQYNVKLDHEVEKRTLELNAANVELQMLAQTDSLTGILNHREFMNIASKYVDVAKRNQTNLQILSLDIDFFKKVNDTYGHQAGDTVLKEFTKTISTSLRKSDIFGRLGGEEFAIILQNTTNKGGMILAEKIRATIENLEIYHENKLIKITLSIGLAHLDKQKNINEILNHSDIALYEAKNNGRNQIKIYQEKQ